MYERQTASERASERGKECLKLISFSQFPLYANSLMISRGIRGMESGSDKMKINDAELNIADEFKGEIPQH